jgi:ribonuclease E
MEKKILINARHPEEKRVAIVEGKELTDFYVEVPSAGQLRGNIYKGVITALDRGLQAAFVNFGPEKQGFLPLREVMPENFRAKPKGKTPNIKEVLAKGQELVVQVELDQRGTKGAKLTNRVSLPGRYLVMIPGKERLGISRKIEDKDARDRLREAFKGLRVPKGMGFILRTAGEDRTTEELSADLKYLTKLWNKIKREQKKAKAPSLLYKEESIAVRTVRDYLTSDVHEVLVDDRATHKDVKRFLKLTMPWRSINVTLYSKKEPIFDLYGLEEQIDRLGDRTVYLHSGGSIVIDRTEALTAIDVNSGRAKDKDIEGLALRTNMDAAAEIGRQLRLRDIGGLIVIDFIDMKSSKNYHKVEERLRKALDLDKAHFDLTRISKFGMLEMSRERMRTAYSDASAVSCPTCGGRGFLRSPERVAISALRKMHTMASSEGVRKLICRLPVESANYLMNQLRERLAEVEKEFSLSVTLVADPSLRDMECSADTEETKPMPTTEEKSTKEPKKSRRGRGKASRKKKKSAPEKQAAAPEEAEQGEGQETQSEQPEAEPATPKKRRPRRYRGRRTPKKKSAPETPSE